MADEIKATIQDNINYSGIESYLKELLISEIKTTGDRVFAKSQQIVPKDTLELMHSAKKEIYETNNSIELVISYNTVYAEKQHEDLSLKHKAGEEGKYLEKPFVEETQDLINNIINKI